MGMNRQHEILTQLDLLEHLGELRSNGIISEQEFSEKKAEILNRISIAINPDYVRERVEKLKEEEAAAALKAAEELEQKKLERFAAYWLEHAEEKDALEKKRAMATEKLGMLGNSAKEERKKIQDLIDAIDEELTRDR